MVGPPGRQAPDVVVLAHLDGADVHEQVAAGLQLLDGPPAVTVYDDAGAKVASGAVPLLDRYRQPGWCGYRLRLGALGVGHYGVTFGYSVGGSARLDAATFEVVAGGHADGAVLAMTHYERPHAAFLVHQAESGTRVFGRNPWV